MILADKIIDERKKNGWSQEELAEKLNVSRQSVSKWESTQSVPDLQRILEMSRVFGVSTDYLLKDEIEPENRPAVQESQQAELRRTVSLQQAADFIKIKKQTAKMIALGVYMCILSPLCLVFLAAASEYNVIAIGENAAAAIGMGVLLLMVAVAVMIFIFAGFKTKPYEFMEKELIDTEYGVRGLAQEEAKRFQGTYMRNCILGTVLCILSVLPLLTSVWLADKGEGAEFLMCMTVCMLLVIVGLGVALFILAGVPKGATDMLLQEGDYSEEKKKDNRLGAPYWAVVTAIYLGYSLFTFKWQSSWIIWPVAAVLFPAYLAIIKLIKK